MRRQYRVILASLSVVCKTVRGSRYNTYTCTVLVNNIYYDCLFQEVIERIARCTRADVLCSMEQLSRPQLGSCQSFRVQRYILKVALLFLDILVAFFFVAVFYFK